VLAKTVSVLVAGWREAGIKVLRYLGDSLFLRQLEADIFRLALLGADLRKDDFSLLWRKVRDILQVKSDTWVSWSIP
jgi:hypothetical protein